MSDSNAPDRLDVTDVDCRHKHGMILSRWNALGAGESFLLVNGHDPLPLYYQFTSQFKGEFDWVYEERGPKSYAIRITRLAEGAQPSPDTAAVVAEGRPSCVSTGTPAAPVPAPAYASAESPSGSPHASLAAAATGSPLRSPLDALPRPPTPEGIDVDARGLLPPEPMQRIMEALAELPAGLECRALTDRRPVHLLPMLVARGFACASEERPDGSWINFIRRA